MAPTTSHFPIVLAAHDPAWTSIAAREERRLREAIGAALLEVHHIGSTSIAGILAKPIVDLLPVVRSLEEVDTRRAYVEALGYEWRGECGIPGRRYAILVASGGERVAQLHVFAEGSPRIAQHVGFRDYLRAHPDEARAYEAEKVRARALHPNDVNAYNGAKSAFVASIDAKVAAAREGT